MLGVNLDEKINVKLVSVCSTGLQLSVVSLALHKDWKLGKKASLALHKIPPLKLIK